MQFEINSGVCRNSVNDINTIEHKLRYQLERLDNIYTAFKISEDRAEKETAQKIKKEIMALEKEIYDISVMRKSLDKLTSVYERNEKQLTQMFDGKALRFLIPLTPAPIKPLYIGRINPNMFIELY